MNGNGEVPHSHPLVELDGRHHYLEAPPVVQEDVPDEVCKPIGEDDSDITSDNRNIYSDFTVEDNDFNVSKCHGTPDGGSGSSGDSNTSSDEMEGKPEADLSSAFVASELRLPHKFVSLVGEDPELLKVNIKLNGQEVQAVIDTGSAYSLMSHDLALKLCLPINPVETQLRVLGDNDFKTIGCTVCSLAIVSVYGS